MIFPRQRQNGLRSDRGFTLIEMIIAIVLIAIMGTFSIGFLRHLMQSSQLSASQKDLMDEAKLAMEFLTRELRFADETVNDVQCGAVPVDCVPGVSYDTITFDKLFGLAQDTNKTAIKYSFDVVTGTLKRTSAGVTTVLATNVAAFSITESTTVPDFYTIDITLQGSEGENFSLESAVRPRSLI